MSLQDWISVGGLICTAMGGVVWLIKGMIRQELDNFRRELQSEQVLDLKRENEKLWDRVNNTK